MQQIFYLQRDTNIYIYIVACVGLFIEAPLSGTRTIH